MPRDRVAGNEFRDADWFRIQKAVPAEPLWTAKQDSISLSGQVGLPGIRHSIGLARGRTLEDQGVGSFHQSFAQLLDTLGAKAHQLSSR
jgi:hypothetical protein